VNSLPKYMQLKQEIISWIHSGKFKPEEKLPSEHEMSELFGFSRQTVRQAIGELVQEGWLERAQGKGTFVSKTPSNTRKPVDVKTVALITTYISDYIFPTIVRGVESTLRSRGYRLLLSSTDNLKDKERESLEMVMSQMPNGLIIEPTKSAEGNPNFNYFLSLDYQNIPYLMIHETYSDLACPCIKLDDEFGGFVAAEHLIQLGHRRIVGFFKTDDLQGINRLKGFTQAHREYGIPLPPNSIMRYSTEDRSTLPHQYLNELLESDQRPSAIVCYNDELAIELLQVIRGKGLQVPNDISIVGFDDANLATATEVKLTTLSHPKEEMGKLAAEMLLAWIEKTSKPENKVFIPELIVRESTRKVER
jgi:GntR family transcriptional regulator, arabinose operon transcriptional repressor